MNVTRKLNLCKKTREKDKIKIFEMLSFNDKRIYYLLPKTYLTLLDTYYPHFYRLDNTAIYLPTYANIYQPEYLPTYLPKQLLIYLQYHATDLPTY